MAKEKSATKSGLMSEVFSAGIYKRNQGRYARQVTFFTILFIVLIAGWQMTYQPYVDVTGMRFIYEAPASIVTVGEGDSGVEAIEGYVTVDRVIYPEGHPKSGQTLIATDRSIKNSDAVQIVEAGVEEINVVGGTWDWVISSSRFVLPLCFIGVIAWLAYRLVNVPKFADFLIAVEAEMYKVSWPTRRELFRSSLVVIFVIFSMAAMLFLFDVAWRYLFESLRDLIAAGMVRDFGDWDLWRAASGEVWR